MGTAFGLRSRGFLAAGLALVMAITACGETPAPTATPTGASQPTATLPSTGPTPAPANTAVAQREVQQGVIAGAIPAAEAAGVKYGGTFRIMNVYEVPDMDPDRHVTITGGMTPVINKLLRWDPFDPTKAVPDLAEGFEVSADGTVYTFSLRRGVKFHNGTDFTAKDVAATYEWMFYNWDNFVKTARLGGQIRPMVKSWRAVDDYKFEVTLNFPASNFINFISSANYGIFPNENIEANLAESKAKKSYIPLFSNMSNPPIGTGPFKLVEFVPSVAYRHVKNPNYFKTDSKGNAQPYIDGITNNVIVDPNLRLATFATHKVDAWPSWPLMTTSDKDRLVKVQGNKIRVFTATSQKFDPIMFNTRKMPTMDPKFRKAIHLLVDRDEYLLRVFEGNATLGYVVDPIAFPGWTLSDDEMKTTPMYLDKATREAEARKLLQEAGFRTPQDVPELLIAIRSTGFYQAEAELLGVLLSRFGIKSKVEVYTTATLTSRTDAGQFDIQTTGPGLTVLDPINVIQQSYLTESSAVKDKWVTALGEISPAQKRVSELYEEYLRNPDVAGRKKALHEIQRQIYTETYQIPLAYPKMWIPVYNDVKGVFVMGLYEGWDRENLWFDR